jgi:hypothetical protein
VIEIAALLSMWLLNMALSFAVVARDRRMLSGLQKARAWNSASFGCAITFFAPICIVAHFWITRRSLRGVMLGLVWLAAVVAVMEAAAIGLDLIWEHGFAATSV